MLLYLQNFLINSTLIIFVDIFTLYLQIDHLSPSII